MFNTYIPPEILNIIINRLPFGSWYSLLFTSKSCNKLISPKISSIILWLRKHKLTIKGGLVHYCNDFLFLKIYYDYHKNTFNQDYVVGILHQSPNLEIILWLNSLNIIDLQKVDLYGSCETIYGDPLLRDYMFYNSCQFNQINVAKWLFYNMKANIYGYYLGHHNFDPYIVSCKNGYSEILKWLHSLNPYHTIKNFDLFHIACKFGHLEIAQWLCTLKLNIDFPNDEIQWICLDYPFTKACKYGHLNVAKWLHSIGADINASDKNNIPVTQIASDNDQIHIVKWLSSINSN